MTDMMLLHKCLSSLSHRYRAIVKPLDVHRSGAGLSVCLRAGAIWLLSVTLAVPEAVFSDLHTFDLFVSCWTAAACELAAPSV